MRLDVVFTTGSSKGTLCSISVTLSFAIFLEGVLDGDFLVHEVLAVHVCDGVVGCFKGGEGNETVALAEVCVVAGDLRND